MTRIAGGGGGYVYPGGGNYSTTTGKFAAPEAPDGSYLSRTPFTGSATSYTRTLQDGSTEVYSKSNGASSFPRLLFLTSITDSAGNTTTLNYDTSYRLTSVVDAMGRSTTFTYGLTGSPLLITQITDAFSRTTQITYDTSGRLNSITDPVGIVSSFYYQSPVETNFITSMTTPYGTTKFNDQINGNDLPETPMRALQTTDPLGYSDFLYFYPNPNYPAASDPAGVPLGLTDNDNGYLIYRNTFYWDKHAFPIGIAVDGCNNVVGENFADSLITHWYHENSTTVGRAISNFKKPLENRVWLDYPSQPSNVTGGAFNHPLDVARILDDGSTQRTHVTYNATSYYPTQVSLPTNPTGSPALSRVTQYNYDTNNIDLLTVKQETNTTGPVYTTVATYGSYNSQHEPQTYTGADGQTWNYTYTAAGQINTVKDPNLNVTTYNYDTSNRLSTIVNALSNTVLTLTYDFADRVATRKDSEGYSPHLFLRQSRPRDQGHIS